MSGENLEIVRSIYDEWSKGNLRAGTDLYDEHMVFIPREGGDFLGRGPYLGLAGLSEWMRDWLKSWTEFRIEAEEFIEAGDSHVVVATHQKGVGRESGTPAEVRYFQVWSFRGQRVIRLEQFRERADALAAVGIEG